MTLEELKQMFAETYGYGGDIRAFFAPGRVNLIGEHIDYNGGHVFPCAITTGTTLIARQREDRRLRLLSANFKRFGVIESSLDDLVFRKKHDWTNYPRGVFWAFAKKGLKIEKGYDILVYGNISGSGLSSSASLEVVTGYMIKDTCGFDISNTDIALIGQYAENNFNGMNCGIMDQYACANGKHGQALYLNTGTLECRYVPLALNGCKIIVANSNKPHSLSSSHYNDRRRECEEALADLQQELDIKALCELTPVMFETYKNLIKSPFAQLRAEHAVYEEDRTKRAVAALENNDLEFFGKLINESGDSLRYQFDATCFEIDVLVEEARNQKGVYGSRETGGGWGGNTVSIVKDEYIDAFIANVGREYQRQTKLKATFSVLEPGDGVRRLF